MTRRPWLCALALVPLLAACSETEEDRARRLAVEAAQRRNAAVGAAILLILVAAYRLWRLPVVRGRLRAPAVGALLANEVVAALLVGTVGAFVGMVFGPQPPGPTNFSMDRDAEIVLWLVFGGPYIAVVGSVAYWLRGAPRRLAAGSRYARLWLAAVHLPLAAIFVGSTPSGEGHGSAWFTRAAATAALATAGLLALDGRRR